MNKQAFMRTGREASSSNVAISSTVLLLLYINLPQKNGAEGTQDVGLQTFAKSDTEQVRLQVRLQVHLQGAGTCPSSACASLSFPSLFFSEITWYCTD